MQYHSFMGPKLSKCYISKKEKKGVPKICQYFDLTINFMKKSSKVVGRRGHINFFWPDWKSISTWKFFRFSKFLLLWIRLGLDHVGPHQDEFLSLNPLESIEVFFRGKKLLISGLKVKSASWVPGFGPRAKLYIVSNTPR